MSNIVTAYQRTGSLSCDINADSLADTLFEMQNIRFFLFISDEDQTEEDANLRFLQDISVIFADKFKSKLKEVT